MNFKESQLKIRLFGDPILRKKARRIKHITPTHRDILSKMAQTMYDQPGGVGLAAVQVGIDEAMIVVDMGGCLYKLMNPRIIKREGLQVMEEGCLSIPGICLKIKRAKKVTVEAQNEEGRPITIEAKDFLACVFQHEIDHLKGRLIVDYASFLQRLKIRKKIIELRKRSRNESRTFLKNRCGRKEKVRDEGLSKSKTESQTLQL